MNYRQPFNGDYPISQSFGEKITDPKGHTGIDYACPPGTPVLASADGTVFYAGWRNGGYGYCVFLKHPGGMVTVYEHLLQDIPVQVGQKVAKSQVIGWSGSTGNSTGPHLHFELRDAEGKAVDPMPYLQNVVDDKPVQQVTLKEPDQLGDLVEVVCPDGAKVFHPDFTMKYAGFPQGTKLHFTGKTAKRPGFPEYTYCEVYEEPKKWYVAVHDGRTQILDNR